uniref:Uncharacterized protein n=1 Tax=Tanacetum cinerariifolium TaxID=118510 RepID=A0A699I4U3_TANCI|nr:hypothetical protein [Tanacetum cinerariifolium]
MIEQQVALDEALVPSTQSCPFFKAFLVTADVSEIYMQEFWATAYVHQHFIKFKLDNKKHIVNLETFRDMLHICPRIPGQSFDELPFEEEILEFLWNIDYAFLIWEDFVYQVEHKNHKKSNEMYYPGFTKPGGSGTDEGTGSKPGVPDVPFDDSEEEILWNSSDDEDVDAQEKNRDDDEGDEKGESDDGEEMIGGDDDEKTKSDEESDGDETREEASFDPIPRTPEDSEDDGNDEEDQCLRISEEERIHEEEEADELYHDMNEAVRVAVQIQTDGLRDSYQRENDEFLQTIDDNMKRIIKEQVKSQVKEQVSKILPRIKQSVNAQLKAKVLTRSSHSSKTSYALAADLSEMELKKILIKKMEGNKSIQYFDEQRNLYKALVEAYEADNIILATYRERVILKRRRDNDDDQEEPVQTTSQIEERSHLVFETGAEDQPVVQLSQHTEWFSQPKKPLTPDRDWNKTFPAAQGSTQTWISELAMQADSRSSFNELLDTPLDFSNFIMNRLRVDTLTPELLARPTYELMKGSCNSLIELEYHLEELHKATTDQFDWVNPEGQQYPHNLLQPLPLIPDNRGRRVILFAHFINNDLEYLRGGDFKRLRLQDIEDMLLLLVQGKLSNLTVEERFAFNVSLRMFTRSIVIQQRMKDLQLGLESYQKRLNLTKPDMYRSDLKQREAYTAYSNPRGFIYQNKDKKNRLMRIDELHKFSDGTLNDVHNALDDRLKGIRMQYLPQTI